MDRNAQSVSTTFIKCWQKLYLLAKQMYLWMYAKLLAVILTGSHSNQSLDALIKSACPLTNSLV